VNSQGRPASPQDAAALLAVMDFSRLNHEQIERIIERSRRPDGRVSMPDARRPFIAAGVARYLGEAGVTPPETDVPSAEAGSTARQEAAPRPAEAGGGSTAAPSTGETTPEATAEAPRGAAASTSGAQAGVAVRSSVFRTPPAGQTSRGQRRSVLLTVVAGFSPARLPAIGSPVRVTLQFFCNGGLFQVSQVPVRFAGSRRLPDGRTVYRFTLTQAVWIESINFTLFPGDFEIFPPRGL
jgi:hypothetical protein